MKDEKNEDSIRLVLDYWNAWQPSESKITFRNELGEKTKKLEPIRTFLEYYQDIQKQYSENGIDYRYDISMILPRFIHQSNRLVKIYNSLISQKEVDLEKTMRVINLEQKIIFQYKQ